MSRLTRAKSLLTLGLKRNLQQIRTILAEAADQADAIGIAEQGHAAERAGVPMPQRRTNQPGELETGHDDAPMCRLSRAILKVGGQPVSEFLLIPFGAVQIERPLAGRDFEFTRRQADSAVRWFDSLGRKLAIDYEHQSFEPRNGRADGLKPAAGWIGGLQVRDDGLWATDVAWTPRATELLAAGEYRYFSPVIFWTDEDYSDVAGLGPVALTNDPAMRGVTSLAAMQRRELADEEQVEFEDDAGARAQLEEAQHEVAILRRRIEVQEADSFVERGMRLGKILDSTSLDWREDYLRDAANAEERLTRAPVLRPPGRQVTAGAARSVGDAQTCELYQRWGIEPADLQAYERAVAGGRVRSAAR